MNGTRHGLLLCALGASASACAGGGSSGESAGAEELVSPGFIIDGAAPGDALVAVPIADVNGDGLGEVLINVERPLHPVAFLVFGKSDEEAVDLAAIEAGEFSGVPLRHGAADIGPDTPASLVTVKSDFYDTIQLDAAAVGDLDGDGLSDVVVVASDAGQTPTAFVVFGDSLAGDLDLPEMFPGHGYQVDLAGVEIASGAYDTPRFPAVEGIRDLNGDGKDELLVRSATGTYVLHGKDDFEDQVLVDDGIRLDDLAFGAYLGVVTGWGSIRGATPTDLVIADPTASPSGRSGAGRAYVLFDALAADSD